jgi:hypothetical protein
MLAATSGRWDEAEAHFQAAIECNTRLGARPWLARTQLGYAHMLSTRGYKGDPPRAHELVQDALATAHNLQMTTLAERAAAQLAATPA